MIAHTGTLFVYRAICSRREIVLEGEKEMRELRLFLVKTISPNGSRSLSVVASA